MNLFINRRTLLNRIVAIALAFMPLRQLFASSDPNDRLDEFLLVALQRMFPHPQVPIEIYQSVSGSMASTIKADSALSKLITAGHTQLDKASAAPWLEIDEIRQTQQLRKIETTPFFQTLRGIGSFSLYNNPEIWPYFGYEGSSFEKGGYLNRGFDDLDWLPDSPP